MNDAMALARVREAFPEADAVVLDVRDYGFSQGIGVRMGNRHHAVKIENGDLDTAIAALRKWGAR